jgi:hypothetical protein
MGTNGVNGALSSSPIAAAMAVEASNGSLRTRDPGQSPNSADPSPSDAASMPAERSDGIGVV